MDAPRVMSVDSCCGGVAGKAIGSVRGYAKMVARRVPPVDGVSKKAVLPN